MAEKPSWLPGLFIVEPWSRELYDRLYSEVFCHDFKSKPIFYRGHAVWFFPEKSRDRELAFVHLTSRRNPATGEREIDPMRSARLPWARPLIEHSTAPEVLAWDFEEDDGSINTYVWLREHDYAIIMRKLGDDSRRLITAYWIEFEHERRKLRRKYERRLSE
jgi:hypothetical protein